jgi:hypothetical protein
MFDRVLALAHDPVVRFHFMGQRLWISAEPASCQSSMSLDLTPPTARRHHPMHYDGPTTSTHWNDRIPLLRVQCREERYVCQQFGYMLHFLHLLQYLPLVVGNTKLYFLTRYEVRVPRYASPQLARHSHETELTSAIESIHIGHNLTGIRFLFQAICSS